MLQVYLHLTLRNTGLQCDIKAANIDVIKEMENTTIVFVLDIKQFLITSAALIENVIFGKIGRTFW